MGGLPPMQVTVRNFLFQQTCFVSGPSGAVRPVELKHVQRMTAWIDAAL